MSEFNNLISMLNDKNDIILSKQAKIDELQERVDEAMRLLQTRQHNPDVTNIIFEMHKILKGNKDEAGLN